MDIACLHLSYFLTLYPLKPCMHEESHEVCDLTPQHELKVAKYHVLLISWKGKIHLNAGFLKKLGWPSIHGNHWTAFFLPILVVPIFQNQIFCNFGSRCGVGSNILNTFQCLYVFIEYPIDKNLFFFLYKNNLKMIYHSGFLIST